MTPEEKNIYDKLEILRLATRKKNIDPINDPYGIANVPNEPKGMMDEISLQDIEHTPVDVLMFTSDITPTWYQTVMYPGTAFQMLGRKQLSDREYKAYLKCAQRDNPIERSPIGLWDYSEHMVYDVTAKGFGGFKIAHEISEHIKSVTL